MASLFRARMGGAATAAAYVDGLMDGYAPTKKSKLGQKYWAPNTKRMQLLAAVAIGVALGVATLAGGWIAWSLYQNPTQYFLTSNTPDQPLYTVKKNFFPPDVFQGLKDRLVDSDLARCPNTLDATNFGMTSGVVLMFNLKGLERFRRDPEYRDMATFLDAVLIPGANAFAVNLLLVQPTHEAPPLKNGRVRQILPAAGFHIDDTLQLNEPFWRNTAIHSHQTTVIYLSIPPDMEGGHYVMDPSEVPGHKRGEKHIEIQPEENMMMAFRGDAGHEVQPFKSKLGQVRCTLVTEQYILPPDVYRYVPEWTSSMDNGGAA